MRINDQHLHVELPADGVLEVGDVVRCGLSHPCTTFDKWRHIPVVDGSYDIVDTVHTFLLTPLVLFPG